MSTIGDICTKLFSDPSQVAECTTKNKEMVRVLEEDSGACIEGGTVYPALAGESTADCFVRQMGPQLKGAVSGAGTPVKADPKTPTAKKGGLVFKIDGDDTDDADPDAEKASGGKGAKATKLKANEIRHKITLSYGGFGKATYSDQFNPTSPFKHHNLGINYGLYIPMKQFGKRFSLDALVATGFHFDMAPEISIGTQAEPDHKSSLMFGMPLEVGLAGNVKIDEGFHIIPSLSASTRIFTVGDTVTGSHAKPDTWFFEKVDVKLKASLAFVLFENWFIGGSYTSHWFSDDVEFGGGAKTTLQAAPGRTRIDTGMFETGVTF